MNIKKGMLIGTFMLPAVGSWAQSHYPGQQADITGHILSGWLCRKAINF